MSSGSAVAKKPSAEELLDSITPRRTGETSFEAQPFDRGAGVVDAGTLTALMTSAAALDGDPLRSIHATFLRSADPARPVELHVAGLHSGRSLGARSVTVNQGDRRVAVAHVVVGPVVEALVEHSAAPASLPPVPGADSVARPNAPHPGFTAVVGDTDPFDPSAAVDGARWRVWVDGAPAAVDATTQCSWLAFHANEYLVSAAVLPHDGFGMGDAHRGVLTVITSSDVVFHQGGDIGRWLLFDQVSTFAGGGWVYGRGEVFAETGAQVASFSQQAILRRAAGAHPSRRD